MSYADSVFYTNTYKGTVISAGELVIALEKASDSIDQLTFNRIRVKGLENLTTFQQRCIKMAVCLQADHMSTILGIPEGVSSYSINGTSMSFGGNRQYSQQASTYLNSTGLTYRGL